MGMLVGYEETGKFRNPLKMRWYLFILHRKDTELLTRAHIRQFADAKVVNVYFEPDRPMSRKLN